MLEAGMIPTWIGAGIEQHAATTGPQSDARELANVGEQFESVFLSLMLKEMRNTLENGGLFWRRKLRHLRRSVRHVHRAAYCQVLSAGHFRNCG